MHGEQHQLHHSHHSGCSFPADAARKTDSVRRGSVRSQKWETQQLSVQIWLSQAPDEGHELEDVSPKFEPPIGGSPLLATTSFRKRALRRQRQENRPTGDHCIAEALTVIRQTQSRHCKPGPLHCTASTVHSVARAQSGSGPPGLSLAGRPPASQLLAIA